MHKYIRFQLKESVWVKVYTDITLIKIGDNDLYFYIKYYTILLNILHKPNVTNNISLNVKDFNEY